MEKLNRTFTIQWHLTDKCDQRCKHCYIWSKPQRVQCAELNIQQCFIVVEKFLEFCKEMKCNPSISLSGGDPFFYDKFWDLVEYIHQNNIPLSILGNPFHLTDDICQNLRHLGCRSYQVSLDGLEKTHDKIRGNKGSFQATLRGLEILNRNGLWSGIMTTVSRDNFKEIPALTKIVVDYNAGYHAFARYSTVSEESGNYLTPQEYKIFMSEMWEIYTKLANHGTFFPLKDHLWKLFLYEKGLLKINKENVVVDGCNCGIKHMTILTNGDVYACRRFDSFVGNILKQTFVDIFTSPQMSFYREIERFEDCKNCELLYYCRGCHAVSYGIYGDFFAKDPQCWKDVL